jgi:hypothetical protein
LERESFTATKENCRRRRRRRFHHVLKLQELRDRVFLSNILVAVPVLLGREKEKRKDETKQEEEELRLVRARMQGAFALPE